MSENQQQEQAYKVRKSTRKLTALVLCMFGFGFAMVPLYDLICSVTGLKGSTTGRIQDEAALSSLVDYSRSITVEFDSTINADLAWDFYPMVKKVTVHPGEVKEVIFYAKNNSNKTIIAQAIPGITPWQATSHFNKTECFCFAQQTLKPGESKEMPLRFIIDTKLPKDFQTITLSYTFMDTDRSKFKQAQKLPNIHSSVNLELPYKNI
jgi:cytochrome c oxidase assembly protein subunit 11